MPEVHLGCLKNFLGLFLQLPYLAAIGHSVFLFRFVLFFWIFLDLKAFGCKYLHTYISKNNAIFSGGYFHICLDIAKIMRGQDYRLWFLNQLQVAQSCKL